MKNTELRIGNLVEHNYGVSTVNMIRGNDIGLHDTGMALWGTTIDKIKPIPLTEEWLMKFGFDLIRNGNEYHNRKINEGAYHLKPVGDVYSHWYFYHKGKLITSNITFIHQLQNLYFALTGEELTIK